MGVIYDSHGRGIGPENPLSILSGAERAETVTTHNTNTIEKTKGIYVGTGGDLSLGFEDGSIVLFKNVAGGCIHPFRATRIRTTGTTASDLVAVY